MSAEQEPKDETEERAAYLFGEIDLHRIRNHNETRVVALLEEVLDKHPDLERTRFNVEDVYALALNLLPARYRQNGSRVWKETVSDPMIRDAIKRAIILVKGQPH